MGGQSEGFLKFWVIPIMCLGVDIRMDIKMARA